MIQVGFPARFTGCQANLISVTNEQLNVAPDFVKLTRYSLIALQVSGS